MTKKLSIIMPCYNCKDTLREAVNSCYTQGFSEDEFEIVMVDDNSTDSTRTIMEELEKDHSNIRLFFHEKNQGGGAARNTAVKNTNTEVIFCLDSDDILPPENLNKMYDCLKDSGMDGVLFDETRFFTTNKHKTESVKNKPLNTPLKLIDVFHEETGFLTQVNFMYKKSAFADINGYPNDHGFDTQSFGLKFLAYGKKCLVCKDTHYLHRHHQKNHKSYYEREYEKGLLSINTFLALEPIIEKLDDAVIKEIINFDIFTKNYHGQNTHLRSALVGHAKTNKRMLNTETRNTDSLEYFFVNLCKSLECEEHTEALHYLAKCTQIVSQPNDMLFYMQVRIHFALSGTHKRNLSEKTADYLTQNSLLTKRKYKHLPAILKPFYCFYKLLK